MGSIPITRQDLAPTDPLKLVITGGRVLDVSLSQVTREVCNVSLKPATLVSGTYVSTISFDFLDKKDGAIVQIITDTKDANAILSGTIIGIPNGIINARERKSGVSLTGVGCLIPIVILLAGFMGVSFLYRYVTGSWTNVWLLAMPFAAFVPAIGLMIPMLILYTRIGTITFPEHLSPPKWYYARSHLYKKRFEGNKNQKNN